MAQGMHKCISQPSREKLHNGRLFVFEFQFLCETDNIFIVIKGTTRLLEFVQLKYIYKLHTHGAPI